MRFCPRCGQVLAAPRHTQSHDTQRHQSWTCGRHGAVTPVHGVVEARPDLLRTWGRDSALPIWMPWPLPADWVVTGMTQAMDGAMGPQAIAVACGGPAPLGGWADLVIVAERPGIGFGAGLADLPHIDPDRSLWEESPAARVMAAGHPAALWSIGGSTDCAVFVGEADGAWLWILLWPTDAGHLLADQLALMDLRDGVEGIEVPCGSLTGRLPHT